MNGYNIYLCGRKINEIEQFAKILQSEYKIITELRELDIEKFDTHQSFYSSLDPKPFGFINVTGFYPDQKNAEKSQDDVSKSININYSGPVSLLNIVANDLEIRREGFIVGISSVSGERGRMKNYIYGSAKSAFTTYLSGLRNRLSKSNTHVLTVIPGYINTNKNIERPKLLTARPADVAKDIFNAQESNKNIIYTKWVWRYIMLVIRIIPEFIFKKLNI